MRESEVRSVDEASDEMSHGWKQEGHHGVASCRCLRARDRHLGLSRQPKAVKFVYHGVDVLSN